MDTGVDVIIALVFGVILLVGGGIAGWFGTWSGRRASAMQNTETVRARDVGDLLGAGLRVLAEVNGRARGDTTLTAPFSGEECVWHRSTVSHHYWGWELRTAQPRARQHDRVPARGVDHRAR